MSVPDSVVVVGESLAGLSAARELRRLGFTGSVTLIGDEPHPAYTRPPLSKQVLVDATRDATLAITADGIDARVHRCGALRVDTRDAQVHLACGGTAPYDALVIATGARARRIAAAGQRGEVVLRTLDDAIAIRDRLEHARSAVVVGAGFLGMEVVSACVRRDIPVTVVDVEPPLRRLLGAFLSDLVVRRASDAGVDVRIAAGPVSLVGDPVTGVRITEDETLTADLVVTCAGDLPNVEWLTGAGLETAPGVVVDGAGRTTVPNVYAAGDVVSVRTADGLVRRPFWSNAVVQGRVVAHGVLGSTDDVPSMFDDYFWTEILGSTVKVVGDLPVHGEPEVLAGELASGALLRWDTDSGRTCVAWGTKHPVPRLRALAAADG